MTDRARRPAILDASGFMRDGQVSHRNADRHSPDTARTSGVHLSRMPLQKNAGSWCCDD